MLLTRLIIIIITIYLAYRFIFHFLLPIYRTSKRVHEQFKGMQQQMDENAARDMNGYQQKSNTTNKGHSEDYIEFEEIK